MTREQVAKVLFYLRAIYPAHFQKYSDNDFYAMVDAWLDTLINEDYEQILAGAKAFVVSDRAGFPPTVGQVLGCVQKATDDPIDKMTGAEMWDKVYKALENLDWMYPEREFEKLPKIAQKIVGSPGALKEIAAMPTTDVMIGERARFIHRYESYQEEEHEYEQIPERIRMVIEEHSPKYVPVNPDLMITDRLEDERQRQNQFLKMLDE